MRQDIRQYLAKIGQRGGRASKRELSADHARAMVRIREARRAYRNYYAQCFWSFAPDLKIGSADIEWVAEQLRKHGGREAWMVADKLCR